MSVAQAMHVEWQRLDLLGQCLVRTRRGESIDDLAAPLRAAQESVARMRAGPPWRELRETHALGDLDQDILACAAAPEAAPRIGWAFEALQPGVGSHFPSPALIQDLMFLADAEAPLLHARLAPQAPLRRGGLIEYGGGRFQPVHPTALARIRLLGRHEAAVDVPPGTRESQVRAGWGDLVLPPRARAGLDELILWETQRARVEQSWGASLGGGPLALFAGPSGTGKTLAAEVLAAALGYRLLRVDLGMLVSKYIGETEKNLNALFDAAHGQAMVLLFDEADALFGRRGEVREAHDRYANMEVGHLLSRIELHRGPCVLTSNLRQHLDPAFLRRFHVVVEFARPEAEERTRLWDLHLPPKAPRADEVEASLLAAAVRLTGAQIRSAAHRAALLAAGEDQVLGLRHLALGIWRELAKEGRELVPAALGPLAMHLPEDAP